MLHCYSGASATLWPLLLCATATLRPLLLCYSATLLLCYLGLWELRDTNCTTVAGPGGGGI